MSLTTTAKVKTLLGIPAGTTARDAMIDDVVAAIDQLVTSECGVAAITQTTYYEEIDTEWASGDLRLGHWPVQSVVAVTSGGSLIGAADYVVRDNGYLRLRSAVGSWAVGVAAVSATYVAGLTDSDLADIKFAATQWAASLVNTSEHAGFESERIGGYAYKVQSAVDSGAMPANVSRALARLKQVFFE